MPCATVEAHAVALKISAFPKCYLDQIAGGGTMSVFDWIAMARSLDVRIHRDLQVRLLKPLELLRDHRHPRRFAAEMVAQALQERPFWDLRAVDDVIEEAFEEKAELFG